MRFQHLLLIRMEVYMTNFREESWHIGVRCFQDLLELIPNTTTSFSSIFLLLIYWLVEKLLREKILADAEDQEASKDHGYDAVLEQNFVFSMHDRDARRICRKTTQHILILMAGHFRSILTAACNSLTLFSFHVQVFKEEYQKISKTLKLLLLLWL